MARYNIKYNGEEHIYRNMIIAPDTKVERENLEETSDKVGILYIFRKQRGNKRLARFVRAFIRASNSGELDKFCKTQGCDFIVRAGSTILATSFPVKTLEELEMTFV
ncbi:MAG: hypothetical protein BHV69_09790 [Bacteroidales bacterium 52_46]|nr:MAG: hypothetical protein BHV69_09790 [Bacteroidales bacterium 52_46]